jgi:DNA-binding NarL/FixJ family response regulator
VTSPYVAASVRVVIVDDHEIVRAGLAALLNRERDIDIVATASSGEEAVRVIDEAVPDIAVVDYSLPGMTGVELCERITTTHPEVSVILLTTYLQDSVIRGALAAGAKAYVYKDIGGVDLKRAIRAVARGESVLDPKVAGRVARWAKGRRYTSDDEARLSQREIDVLRLVAKGLSNKDIGAEIGLTENTVRTYMRRSMAKLGCQSRTEAAALAARRGLL